MALLAFIRLGGSRARMCEIFDLAHARSGKNDDEGTEEALPQGRTGNVPSSSSNADGGTSNRVSKDHTFRVPPSAPRLNLYGATSLIAKNAAAQSIFDKIKTSDGRAWGDVGAHELDGMERDGTFARAIKKHIGVLSNEQRFKPIRELLSPQVFERIRDYVNEQ
jgi:hypothetical protein